MQSEPWDTLNFKSSEKRRGTTKNKQKTEKEEPVKDKENQETVASRKVEREWSAV